MPGAPTNHLFDLDAGSLKTSGSQSGPPLGVGAAEDAVEQLACFHCGEPCLDPRFSKGDKTFCCPGCLFVHDLLTQGGLEHFYDLETHPGVRIKQAAGAAEWQFLDDPPLQMKLLDFSDGTTSRVTFHIPSIHCVACVWLLENLFRLLPGVGSSHVNFPRRQVSISFSTQRVPLSRLVACLASIGYAPELNFGQMDRPKRASDGKRLWLQVGVAGFAFGNIMLFSLPAYLGLDSLSGVAFKALFGWLSLALVAPVLVYSALEYWRAAYFAVRQRRLTLEVPIAFGLVALYAQSIFEVVSGRGEGYADSLAGLVFFLLCGRVFQQKTHERLVFDRDFKSFFPLSVRRRAAHGEESIALANLRVGDRLLVRSGELIPADSRLLNGPALIDYSFVTGESAPVSKLPGDHLYAGGQQVGGRIELQTVKPVSQSYLASLWNHEVFRKERDDNLNTLTNRYSRRFTRAVIGIACAAALFWALSGHPARGLKAFTSVLIVACPCALALAAPFAVGTAQRALERIHVFLRNGLVIERLAEADTIVFDKTGTLTTTQPTEVAFLSASSSDCRGAAPASHAAGEPDWSDELPVEERSWVRELAGHSTHPHSRQIAEALDGVASAESLADFIEVPGHGIGGSVAGHAIYIGSRAWLERFGIPVPASNCASGSASYLAIDGEYRGAFVVKSTIRPGMDQLFAELGHTYDLTLLSGDNEREKIQFDRLLGPLAQSHFNQTPLDKLTFIEALKQSGKTIVMVGDGLNDAGALKRSDVGIAAVEKIGVFSPASDIILEASRVPQLARILDFARRTTRVVRASFVLSAGYNVIGITIAAAGILSPLICAVLMPLSSITVVLFACGMTSRGAKRAGIHSAPEVAKSKIPRPQRPGSPLSWVSPVPELPVS